RHLLEDPLDAPAAEQIDRGDLLAGLRVRHGRAHPRGDPRRDEHQADEEDEEREGVWQPVPDPLDRVQQSRWDGCPALLDSSFCDAHALSRCPCGTFWVVTVARRSPLPGGILWLIRGKANI